MIGTSGQWGFYVSLFIFLYCLTFYTAPLPLLFRIFIQTTLQPQTMAEFCNTGHIPCGMRLTTHTPRPQHYHTITPKFQLGTYVMDGFRADISPTTFLLSSHPYVICADLGLSFSKIQAGLRAGSVLIFSILASPNST